MTRDKDESRSFWRRYIWNHWVLAALAVAVCVGGFLMARRAWQASNVGELEKYYQKADEIDR
jgi:hypothetical protein